MNEALRLEGVNASAGVEHPPFHFDYLDVTDETANAHAFQRENFSFIVVTFPMIGLLWRSSHALSRSPFILNPLRLNPEVNVDALHGFLFQIQLDFLVAHEYTHHIHRHCVGRWPQTAFGEITRTLPSKATSGTRDGRLPWQHISKPFAVDRELMIC
jgi:hypothetical protein